jgi:hypothetical protein
MTVSQPEKAEGGDGAGIKFILASRSRVEGDVLFRISAA